MKKYIHYILALFLISSCETIENEVIERRWISNLEIDVEKKYFSPNYIFELNDGEGYIAEVGNDKVEFYYELKGNKIVLKEPRKTIGEILSYDQDNLVVDFLELDTLKFVPLESKGADLKRMKNFLIGKSFDLENQNGDLRHLVHFTENEMFLLSLDIYNVNEKFPKLSFRRLAFTMENISNLSILRVGGMTERLGYPLIGILEEKENHILVNTYAKDGFYQSKLRPFNSTSKKVSDVLFAKQWRLYGGERLETFDFLENGQINHEKNGVKSKLKWSIDNSGKLITIEDDKGNKNYGVFDFEKNIYRIGYEFSPGKFSDMLNIII